MNTMTNQNKKQDAGNMVQRGDFDGKHPLTRRFQYEYALYLAVSELFGEVQCNSRCLERLMLYYKELPSEKKESVLEEARSLVLREVAGKVRFPMMQKCRAKLRFRLLEDGTHELVLSDGIYAFAVRFDGWKKDRPVQIRVQDDLLIRFPQKIA